MRTRVFEEDPDLLRGVPEEDAFLLKREVAVDLKSLPRGPWSPPPRLRDERLLGLLVLDGLLIREEMVMGERGLELLGRGELLRPSQRDEMPGNKGRWTVLEPARLAVLDRDFQLAITQQPEITVELMRRAIAQARKPVVALALTRRRPLVKRIDAVLWRLTDRFGFPVWGPP